MFLIQAYQIALEKLGTNNTRWKKDCCQEAVNRINDIGFDTTINANTLMNWNIDFRKYEQFHHPDIHVANNIKPTPAMFEYFPQEAVDASLFILNHLDHFNVEMLRGEIIDKIIPSLKEEMDETGDANNTNIHGYNLLCNYMAKQPSYTTVLRWVHYLGFKQDSFKNALVSKCISRDVLTKDQVRRFCKRARSYMLTYKSLELSDTNNNEDGIVNNVTLTKIENMKKVLKSHRAALDFDKSFIMSSITANDFNLEELEFVGVKRERGQKRGRTGDGKLSLGHR